MKIRLKDILESEVEEKYYLSDKAVKGFLAKIERNKDNYVLEPKIIQVGNIVETERFGGNPTGGRIYSPEGISPCVTCMQGGGLEPKILNNYRIRKLTPRECWRLMGVKDEQFDKLHDISKTQLYKMAGNSIVVDVLMGIFRNLLIESEEK